MKQTQIRSQLKVLFLIVLVVLSPSFSEAEDQGNLFERSRKRASVRWTLSEWLAQKERNKLMDLWLAMNTPSPYEFSVGSSYNNYKTTDDQEVKEYTHYFVDTQMYAKIFGIGLEYENRYSESENDLTGLFNFRLLGNSIQSTHLTLHYGLRTRTLSGYTPTILLRNQFAQISLQMYLNSQFGLRGIYRSYLPYSDATLGDVGGQLTRGGAFIEFDAIRIYGEWFQEIQKNSGSVNSTSNSTGTNNSTTTIPAYIERTGLRTGIEIYF